MKFSYNWLKEFVDMEMTPKELGEFLTMRIVEVENVERIGKGLDLIFIAEIREIKPHPNADRLRCVKIFDGTHTQEVVCGAPNIVVGQKVPFARAGVILPNGVKLEKAVIRGVESNGMLCAADELKLGNDHSGIYILGKNALVGARLDKFLGMDDYSIDIDNKALSHRPDLLSHWGLAKEIAAFSGKKLKKDFSKLDEKRFLDEKTSEIDIEIDEAICPVYFGALLSNIKIAPSPEWLVAKLRALGIESINNIVDATNFVMAEIGEPLHAFDYNRIANASGGTKKIIVRSAWEGEKIMALDKKEYALAKGDMVVADKEKIFALGGMIGGLSSGINDETQRIVIEAANFNAVNIRKTARRLGIHTDATTRFERSTPLILAGIGLDRALSIIEENGWGKVIGVKAVMSARYQKTLAYKKTILVEYEKINEQCGTSYSINELHSFLRALNFSPTRVKGNAMIRQVVAFAKKNLGKPYKYGASTSLDSPDCFDCSSFVRYVFTAGAGYEDIARPAIAQFDSGAPIDLDNLKVGDLIFMKGALPRVNPRHPNGIGHVALFIGSKKVIHADGVAKKVVIDAVSKFLKNHGEFRGARRVIDAQKEYARVSIPKERTDLTISQDIVEEVVKYIGVNSIVPVPIGGAIGYRALDALSVFTSSTKNILRALGFDEMYNYSFYGENELVKKYPETHFEVLSPMNPDQNYMRVSLAAHLYKNIEKNLGFFDEIKIFEIGHIFRRRGQKTGIYADEDADLRGWGIEGVDEKIHCGAFVVSKNQDAFFSLKAALEKIFGNNFTIAPYTGEGIPVYFDWMTLYTVAINNNEIGYCGLLPQKYLNELKYKGTVAYMEFDMDRARSATRQTMYRKISEYPPAKFDIAFIIDESVPYRDIEKTLWNTDKNIALLECNDIFRDTEKIGKNKKSITFSVILQSSEKTLTSNEVNEVIKKMSAAMRDTFNAQLRDS